MLTVETVITLLVNALDAAGDAEAVAWVQRHRATVAEQVEPIVQALLMRRSAAAVADRQTFAGDLRGAYVYGMVHRPLDLRLLPDAVSAGMHPAFPHGIVGVTRALSEDDRERLGLMRVLTDTQLEAHARAFGRSKGKYAAQVAKMGIGALAPSIEAHTRGIYVPSPSQYARWVQEGVESAPVLVPKAVPTYTVPDPEQQRQAVAVYRKMLDAEERQLAKAGVGRASSQDTRAYEQYAAEFDRFPKNVQDVVPFIVDLYPSVWVPVASNDPNRPIGDLPGKAVARLDYQGFEFWLFETPKGGGYVLAKVPGVERGAIRAYQDYGKWNKGTSAVAFDTVREASHAAIDFRALVVMEGGGSGGGVGVPGGKQAVKEARSPVQPWIDRGITPGTIWKLLPYVDNSDVHHSDQVFSWKDIGHGWIELSTLPYPPKPGDQVYTRTLALDGTNSGTREWIADVARAADRKLDDWPAIPALKVKSDELLPLNTVVRMKAGKGKLWIVVGHKGSRWGDHGGPNELAALSGGYKGSSTSASADELIVLTVPGQRANANDDGVVRWDGPEAGKRYQSYAGHIGRKNRLPFVMRGSSPEWYLAVDGPKYLMLLHQGSTVGRFRRDTDTQGAWDTLARSSKDDVGYLWDGSAGWFHVIRSAADIERVTS